jgi:DNA-binding response OmpR family regulator
MVLIVTAASTSAERVTGRGLGADDYLPKPLHIPDSSCASAPWTRRQPATQPRILRAAGIELDPLHRTLTHDGQQTHVSPKEFAVLEALMTAAQAPSGPWSC